MAKLLIFVLVVCGALVVQAIDLDAWKFIRKGKRFINPFEPDVASDASSSMSLEHAWNEPPQTEDSERWNEPPRTEDSERWNEPPRTEDSESWNEPPRTQNSDSWNEPPRAMDSKWRNEPPRMEDDRWDKLQRTENSRWSEPPRTEDSIEASADIPIRCTQKPETGPCKGRQHRFYFDKKTKTCKMFVWGGCGGNLNRFKTQSLCEGTCLRRTESQDVCQLPKEAGPCTDPMLRYYYDRETQECKQFKYGGCRGNGNNFRNMMECKNKCVKSTDDTNLPRSFRCVRDGIYMHPLTCKSFVQCSNGKPFVQPCPTGLHYSEHTQTCVRPCDAYCDWSLANECNWSPPVMEAITTGVKCIRDGLYRHPETCTKFIHCSNGNPSEQDCPSGLNFRMETQRCESPCDAHCDSSIAEECRWERARDFRCIRDGLYKHPENCEKFIQCSNGSPYEHECPKGLHFSVETLRCEGPCDAHCDENLAEECDWKRSSSIPEDFRCIRDGLYKHPENCEKFIQCSNGNPYEHECPKGLHFSVETQRCEGPCDAHCDEHLAEECNWEHEINIPEHFKCVKNGLFKHHETCEKFIQCSSGSPYEHECSRGLHFSVETQKCESPCDAHCDGSLEEECGWGQAIADDDEVDCEAKAERGPCFNFEPRFYYDTDVKRCRMFNYGGCKGNTNNFKTIEECKEACPKKEIDENDLRSSPKISLSFSCKRDGLFSNPDSCRNYLNCSMGVPYIISCPPKLHFNNESRTCERPCSAHCDARLACSCQWEECASFSAITRDDKIDCDAEPLVGPCRGAIPRYYYDRDTDSCRKFIWGGCGGNSNKFATIEDCRSACKSQQTVFKCRQPNGVYPYVPDCEKFIKCSRGKPKIVRCENGKAFDKKKERCVPKSETTCLSVSSSTTRLGDDRDFICPTVEGNYPKVDDCGSYWKCEEGIPHIINCGEKAFNPEKSACDNKENVSCPAYQFERKVICYFDNQSPSNHVMRPEDMSPYLCTHIHYNHVKLQKSGDTFLIESSNKAKDINLKYYEKVNKLKEKNQKLKVMLTLGGWEEGKSSKYAELMAKDDAWDPFIDSVVEFLQTYSFDGLDFDWEFPVCRTIDCNGKEPNEEERGSFESFLELLYSKLQSKGLLLSVRVSGSKPVFEKAYQIEDLSKTVDYIVVMAYIPPGENQTDAVPPSILHDTRNTKHSNEDMESIMSIWKKQVQDPKKLVLGVRADARSYRLKDAKVHDIYAPVATAGIPPQDIQFYKVCKDYLTKKNDWTQEKSEQVADYIYQDKAWIGYQSPESMRKIAEHVYQNGYGGVALISNMSDDFKGTCCQTKNPLLKGLVYGFAKRGLIPSAFGCP